MSGSDPNLQHRGDGDRQKAYDENQILGFLTFWFEYLEVKEKWKAVQKFLEDHPVAGIFIIVTIAMWTIPVLVFTMFVVCSVALTLTGFFLMEGTVVAIGTFILGGVLFFVGLFAIGVSMFLVGSYYFYQMSGDIWHWFRGKCQHLLSDTGGKAEEKCQ